ncbi:unnamed protein product [Mytilus coruscus]|uniref:Uncharacterized protein n=1 Tax=Mytilus coruscus TaxID=42192 RepID=A0A6J7ZZR9_MYTCO|nr:unnamed protein product [Mytilus coruscus]
MSRTVTVIFFVIFAEVTTYTLPSETHPDECSDDSGHGYDYNGYNGGHQNGGSEPDHGKNYYKGGHQNGGGSHHYHKHCPCKKPHRRVDFVFVIKLVKKNYRPPGHRRHGYVSIHTDVLQVCQNDKKKKPYSGRSRQPMARLETLANADPGCGPFDGMKEGRCYIVRGLYQF